VAPAPADRQMLRALKIRTNQGSSLREIMSPIIVVEKLVKEVPTAEGGLGILKGISFEINPAEAVAIVGASGSGKSTLLGLMAGLDLPSSGSVRVDGTEITGLDEDARAALRGRLVGFVFQSFQLLPGLSALENVMLPLELAGRRDARAAARGVLDKVGLGGRLGHYPRQLSGGEQQRVAIARSLCMRPKIMLFDEPTSALDVSVQSQILNLLQDLRREFGLTYVIISHNLAVVEHMATRVAVMYLGRLVETAPAADLYARPLHPYTHALFSAVPSVDPDRRRRRIILPGDVPSPANPPAGCRFHPRCPHAMDVCHREFPEMKAVKKHHQVACYWVNRSARSS